MKDPANHKTANLPLPDPDLDDGFELDDTPLTCPRSQDDDRPCESCQ